jgi:hypothetical protein
MMGDELWRRERSVFIATVKAYVLQWMRSRAPIGLAVFVAALCWYDSVALRQTSQVWTLLALVAPWSGFLVAYDTYQRLRADGSLRLMLLHGERRATLALGFASAGVLLGLVATLISIAYLLISGRINASIGVMVVVPLTTTAIAGWVVYSQLMSLLVPRDTAAVLGVILLVFGSRTPESWVPPGAPAWVKQIVVMFWSLIPTSARLSDVLNGRQAIQNVGIQVLQIACAFAAVTLLLSRRALLVRQRVED